jgi:hypothetical protein|tara:strand:- start:323 stop:469 length:147 start_codon:yes stop_codon:yes gene_type:complete
MNQWVIKPLIPPVNHQKEAHTPDREEKINLQCNFKVRIDGANLVKSEK